MFNELFRGSEKTRIEQVAWDLRRQFESGEAYTPGLMRLYNSLLKKPIEDIEGFFRSASQLFPRNNCGIATAALFDRLGGQISKDLTYGGISHTVLELGDRIVDITADQFGGPTVYVGKIIAPWHVRHWAY